MINRKLIVSLVCAVALLITVSPALADGPWTVITSGTGSGSPLGDVSGVEREVAQTFKAPGTGPVSAFKIQLGANTGSPTGNITWKICADYLGTCGFVLGTGSFTATASALNTVTITDGPVLTANGNYWLVFLAADQASNNSWTFVISTASTYADGSFWISADREATWSVQAGDMNLWLTIAAVSATNTPQAPTATPTPANTATPTITPSPTPNYLIEVTATSGAPMALERTATYGDLANFGGLLIVAGVLFFIFVYTYWRDRARAGIDS